MVAGLLVDCLPLLRVFESPSDRNYSIPCKQMQASRYEHRPTAN